MLVAHGVDAERLRQLVEEHAFTVNEEEMHITTSIGVAAFTEEDMAPITIVRRAVAALAQAKKAGKNSVR